MKIITNERQFKELSKELKKIITMSQTRKLSNDEHIKMCELQHADDEWCSQGDYRLGL